jgi:hypothetical protein
MSCDERDAELLLLAHGELGWWQRIKPLAHLCCCGGCRRRFREFAKVSAFFLSAARAGATPGTGWFLFRLAQPVLAVTLLMMAIATVFSCLVVTILERNRVPELHPIPKMSAGCTPNLPNDRCR